MNQEEKPVEQKIIPLDSIQDAQLLLEYIAQQGIDIDQNTVSAIVKAKHSSQSGQWTPEVEANFWQAFNAATKKAAPANIDSIKANKYPPIRSFFKFKTTYAEWDIHIYRSITLVVLVILVIFQVYWLIGTNTINEINICIKEEEKILAEIEKIKGKKTKSTADSEENAKLRGKLEFNITKYYANFTLLEKWNNIWDSLIWGKNEEKPKVYPDMLLDNIVKSSQKAQLALQVLQLYILPPLYGLLGACAYTLRSLLTKMKAIAYTPGSHKELSLRMTLGTLAGLGIGWFATPETSSIFKNLTPFALAFLAGYGVELFFTAMDKIINAFTGK